MYMPLWTDASEGDTGLYSSDREAGGQRLGSDAIPPKCMHGACGVHAGAYRAIILSYSNGTDLNPCGCTCSSGAILHASPSGLPSPIEPEIAATEPMTPSAATRPANSRDLPPIVPGTQSPPQKPKPVNLPLHPDPLPNITPPPLYPSGHLGPFGRLPIGVELGFDVFPLSLRLCYGGF